MRPILSLLLLLAFFMAPCANAGRIVVNHDEWTTTTTGFAANPPATTAFVENVAAFISGGAVGGNFLAYSSNFSLANASFTGAMTSAGYSITVSTAVTFDLPTLLGYDGVFLAGDAADTTVLTDYVNAGGGVYLSGGTGVGGATAEANRWNPFLNSFGLNFLGGAYNGVGAGSFPVNGVHPIFNGVSSLYYNNGNTVQLVGGNPNAQIVESLIGGPGLIGVYDDTSTVPEPTSLLLFGGGLAVLYLRRRKT